MNTCIIKRTGYDSFLDYLKGVSIIFVILTHCISPLFHKATLFCLWGDMAVPLFLLIQAFHAYKKGLEGGYVHLGKLWNRIILPFLITQALAVVLLVLWQHDTLGVLAEFGNLGPGAYYPYIYLQFALLLGLFSALLRRINNIYLLGVVFIILSQILEFLSINMPLSKGIYRFLFFRYTFLIFLGYLLATGGLRLNIKTMLLSLVSMLFILICDGIIPTDEYHIGRFFYMSSYGVFHWLSYFWVSYILLTLIFLTYKQLSHNNICKRFLVLCGKYSYEIFLFQMVFFLISPFSIITSQLPIDYIFLEPLALSLNILCCTIPIIIAKKLIYR